MIQRAIIPLSALLALAAVSGRPHLFAILAISLAVALCWRRLARVMSRVRPGPSSLPRIRISDIRPGRLVLLLGPVLEMPGFRDVRNAIEQGVKPHILRSGTAENPRLLGTRSVLYLVLSIMVMAPAGAALALLVDPALAAVAALPAAALGAYQVMLRSRTSDRRSAIEGELAPFAAMAGIMESASVSLFSTMSMISRSGIFPAMRKEGRRISDMASLGMSPTDALMDLAASHPNPSFRDLISGYVSSFNTGGADTAAYLQGQAGRLFRSMQSRMSSYARQAEGMAQVMLVIMMLVPMMGLSMTFFASGHHAQSLMLVMLVALPLVAAVMVWLAHSKQPVSSEGAAVSIWILPAGAACSILAYLLGGQIWEVIGSGVAAGCITNAVLTRRYLARAAGVEAALPEFMRQMTRLRNIGIDVGRSIGMARETAFGGPFDALLAGIHRRMAAGEPLEAAVAGSDIPSRNARIVFLMLGKIHESGGGTAKTLDDITRWVTEYADAKKEMVASLRGSLMTAFVGPVLMVMMSAISDRMAEEFGSIGPSHLGGALGSISIAPDPLGLSQALTVVASACMGVVLSKINYYSARHTLFTGIITASTMGLIYAAPYFPDL